MCIRDSVTTGAGNAASQVVDHDHLRHAAEVLERTHVCAEPCLLYTSDAADERSSVDLGGRRIIKKQTQ